VLCRCLWLGVTLVSGCGRGGAARGSSEDSAHASGTTRAVGSTLAPATSATPSATALGPVRPSRRYYLGSSGERCFIYWEEAEHRSDDLVVPCPRELAGGERIRVSDRICFLESGPASRDRPVRCPSTLIEAEMKDRLDAGLAP